MRPDKGYGFVVSLRQVDLRVERLPWDMVDPCPTKQLKRITQGLTTGTSLTYSNDCTDVDTCIAHQLDGVTNRSDASAFCPCDDDVKTLKTS